MQTFQEMIRYVDAGRTKEQHRAQSKALAEESFADHVIEPVSLGVYRCARPKSSHYMFFVVDLPGMIVVYGDIGDMMVQGTLGWLEQSIMHDRVHRYVMDRVRPHRDWRQKEFFGGDALVHLKEIHYGKPHIDDKGINFVEQAKAEGEDVCDSDWEVKPNPELASRIADDWLRYDETGGDGDAWSRALYEHTGDTEGLGFRDYNSNDLWCYWALSWFIRNREKVTDGG